MIPELSGDFIQWLRGFYYTAQTGSMTEAAVLMNRNQSAITHQIKCLEKELQADLFAGSKGKRILTPEGKRLFRQAVKIFDIVTELKGGANQPETSLGGGITVAAPYTCAEFYLPSQAALFSAQHPEIRFNIHARSRMEDMLADVRTGRADFAILRMDSSSDDSAGKNTRNHSQFVSTPTQSVRAADLSGLRAEPLFTSGLTLISPDNGPLAVTRPPTPEILAGLPFVRHADLDFMDQAAMDLLIEYGINLDTAHWVSHCGPLKRCVANGLGVAIVESFACRPEDSSELCAVSLDHLLPPRHFGAIMPKNADLPVHVQVFLRFLLNNSPTSH
ncbi:MAG: LysR family transcriptional regulator [Deltaproteobacteria bacterium]|jgi:DNA-binding transcriptional LysR family regulator|nr:LysR family transcriptional regulator [Deltaproteobacteria bacterium]